MGSCLGVFKEGDGITWKYSRHRGLGTSHTGVLQDYEQQQCLSALCRATFNIVVYAGNDFN